MGQSGTSGALCNGMREHYPRTGFGFVLTLIALVLAAKFIFTTIFTRFAY